MGEPDVREGSEEPAAPTPSRGRLVASALAVVALVAALGAAALASTGDDGADSPATAVHRTLLALEARDAVGVVESLAPDERDVLGPALPRLADRLGALDLLAPVDLSDVPGLEVDLDGPRFQVHELDDQTAAVDVVAGRLTVAGGDDVPLRGDSEAALANVFEIDARGTLTRDFAQHPLRLVAIESEGRWSTSLVATLLDGVLADQGTPAEAVADAGAVEPAGAPTPDGAVRALLEGWADGSPERSLAVLDPEQAAVAQRWGNALLALVPPSSAEVVGLDLDVAGDGSSRTVEVRDLEVRIQGDIDVQTLTYDGDCLRAERRFDPADDPWVTFDDCGDDAVPTDGEAERERERERDADAEREREREAAATGEDEPEGGLDIDPAFDLDAGVRLGPPAVDREERERREAAERRRPRDNPVSALAVFGGGSALPTFAVVEHDGAWYVQPTTTLVDSLLGALDDQDVTAERLLERVHDALRPDESTEVLHESRDPDNVLFGSATEQTSPLVASCFRTVLGLAGEEAMVEHGTACVRHLEAAGRLDGQPVPALLGAARCLEVGPSSPPAAEDPVRRFYLTAVARRACVADLVTAGGLPPEALDSVDDPAEVPCYEPYRGLAPDDPEAAWAAADAQVAACSGVLADGR